MTNWKLIGEQLELIRLQCKMAAYESETRRTNDVLASLQSIIRYAKAAQHAVSTPGGPND